MAKQATPSIRLGLVGATGAMGRRVLAIVAPATGPTAPTHAAPKVVLAGLGVIDSSCTVDMRC